MRYHLYYTKSTTVCMISTFLSLTMGLPPAWCFSFNNSILVNKSTHSMLLVSTRNGINRACAQYVHFIPTTCSVRSLCCVSLSYRSATTEYAITFALDLSIVRHNRTHFLKERLCFNHYSTMPKQTICDHRLTRNDHNLTGQSPPTPTLRCLTWWCRVR